MPSDASIADLLDSGSPNHAPMRRVRSVHLHGRVKGGKSLAGPEAGPPRHEAAIDIPHGARVKVRGPWSAFQEACRSNGPLTAWRDLREGLLSVALQESLKAAALARVHQEVRRIRYLVDKHAYVMDGGRWGSRANGSMHAGPCPCAELHAGAVRGRRSSPEFGGDFARIGSPHHEALRRRYRV